MDELLSAAIVSKSVVIVHTAAVYVRQRISGTFARDQRSGFHQGIADQCRTFIGTILITGFRSIAIER